MFDFGQPGCIDSVVEAHQPCSVLFSEFFCQPKAASDDFSCFDV